jgi:DNA-binding MarR family transcriptional regulator
VEAAEIQADELVILVVRAAKAMVERLRAEHPGDGSSPMTVVHGLAARYLVGRDDVTAVELARYLGITKQSTSEVVALLEQSGIVRRAPHPRDGRARVLRLTDAGAAKLAAGRERWQRIEDEWVTLVGRDDLNVVRNALEAFLATDAAMSSGPMTSCSGSREERGRPQCGT